MAVFPNHSTGEAHRLLRDGEGLAGVGLVEELPGRAAFYLIAVIRPDVNVRPEKLGQLRQTLQTLRVRGIAPLLFDQASNPGGRIVGAADLSSQRQRGFPCVLDVKLGAVHG